MDVCVLTGKMVNEINVFRFNETMPTLRSNKTSNCCQFVHVISPFRRASSV